MAERYKVSVRVVSQKGTCALEHKVGDQWIVDGKTPEGICISAFDTLFTSLLVLMFLDKLRLVLFENRLVIPL